MNKTLLIALPVLAVLAVAGFAAASPMWDAGDMTAEEKAVRIQMLEQKRDMIQDELDYLNGLIDQDAFQERLEQHAEEMEQLREQSGSAGCPMGRGMRGFGFRGGF